MSTYWFYRPAAGRSVSPIAWQGWAVIAGFVGAMVGGGVLFLLLGLMGLLALGIAVFVFCAVAGAATFIWAATTKSTAVRPSSGETSI
ncbi:hypothetical protein [Devosia sp.]|uniref:hypothetical protein n=1 Tax=Devosia sp. TaxID=1871048 RepID=UPI003BAA49F9